MRTDVSKAVLYLLFWLTPLAITVEVVRLVWADTEAAVSHVANSKAVIKGISEELRSPVPTEYQR